MLRAPARRAPAADVHEALAAFDRAATAAVDALGSRVTALVGAHPPGGVPPAALDELEGAARGVLDAGLDLGDGAGGQLPVSGAGWVVAPGVVAGAPRAMAWWLGPPLRRLAAVLDPAQEGFRDYARLPWYAVPAASGRRHVTGPYVDWLCTEGYTLTVTAPVAGSEGFAGVVGVDVEVAAVERVLLPLLRGAARPTAVVNAEGRVVVGSTAALSTGALVREVPVRSMWAAAPTAAPRGEAGPLHRLPDLPLGVLTLFAP